MSSLLPITHIQLLISLLGLIQMEQEVNQTEDKMVYVLSQQMMHNYY